MTFVMRAIDSLMTRTVKSLLRSFTISSTGHLGSWIYTPLPLLGGEDDIVVSVKQGGVMEKRVRGTGLTAVMIT